MTTLILLPGLDGTGELFGPFVAALHSRFRTVVIQYPRSVSLGYKELVAFVRDKLPVDDEFVILGESFSGPIAISLAAQAPANLRGLILCASFVRCPLPWPSLLNPLSHLLRFELIPASVLSLPLLGSFGNPAARQMFVNALSTVDASVLRSRIRSVIAVDVREEAASIKVPCLLLQASMDWLVPGRTANVIRERVPRLQVTEVPGPHMLLQISPAACVVAVEAFIDETIREKPPY